jgi:anaerobic magnesium-protoporphyrin IX monomethyl ester cyclase
MKILLVLTEINQRFGQLGAAHGLMSISAYLKQTGYPDIHFGYYPDKGYLQQWQDDLDKIKPQLIGIYATAPQFQFIQKMIQAVSDPNCFIILGGPHPTIFHQCLEQTPRLNAICIGEGEYPMLELAQVLEQGKDFTRIKNLRIRHQGRIIENPTRPLIQDLDSLPFVDRELGDHQKVIDNWGLSQVRILAGRGCPFNCTFCSNHRIRKMQEGRYVRFRSANHIIEEIKVLQKKYRFNEILFDDDICWIDRNLVYEFAERYKKEIGLPFMFSGRVEILDRDKLTKLKEAGGTRVGFGVEHGDQTFRSQVLRRKTTNKQMLEISRIAREVGLQIKTLNMVGLPGETPELHQATVKLNQQIQPDVAGISIFYPFPGTDLYDLCLKEGYLKEDQAALNDDDVIYKKSILDMPQFEPEAIQKSLKWFAFKVFWPYSKIRAIGYRMMLSDYGEVFLAILGKLRRPLRKLLKGL